MEILMYFLWLIVVAYIILTIDSIRTRTIHESICRTVNYHRMKFSKMSFEDISFGVGELNSYIYRIVSSTIEWYNKTNNLKCELTEKYIQYISGMITFPHLKFIDKLYNLNMHKKRFDYYDRIIAFRNNLYYNTSYISGDMDYLISNKLSHKAAFNKEKFWWMKKI